MSYFELGMMICFGISWPVSVIKSIRSKTTGGKSIVFSICIFVGYILGILHKLLFSLDYAIYVYLFNLIMVGLDIVFYAINYQRDKKRELFAKAVTK